MVCVIVCTSFVVNLLYYVNYAIISIQALASLVHMKGEIAMAKSQHIDPVIAAHQIASALSNKFISKLNEPGILSPDGLEISNATKKAAQLYAISYDEAYEYFSKCNDDLIKNPD